MPECRDQWRRIEAFLADSIAAGELRKLLAHAATCEHCRTVLELHRELVRTREQIPEPTEREFRGLRQSVLAEIASRGTTGERRSPVRVLSRWWSGAPILRPALVTLLVIAAVLVGRWSAAPGRLDDDLLLSEIKNQAVEQTGLSSYWDARFTFANVSVRPLGSGSLMLDFDVCRRLNVVTSRHSPLAREVLVNAILDPGTLGTRLKAMQLAPELQDERLREALVFALHNDPDPTVRLEALSLLIRDYDDTLVMDAVLQTLHADASVQVRLAALEALAARRVDARRIRQTIQTIEGVGNRAVLQQAMQRLNIQ